MKAGSRRWIGTCLAAALVGMAISGCGASGKSSRSAASAAREWSAPNADVSNTRRLDTEIDAANVRRLHIAWSVPLRGAYAATPVVAGGVAYTADLLSNVYAIELASGRLKWEKDFEINDTGPNGVNVAGGRVYGATPGSAYALDASTGRELWSTRLIRGFGELIVMTPGYRDGVVYVSTAPVSGGGVGTLWAMDAQTGRKLWHWDEVPRSLWGDPADNGGGGLWHPPAFDERGALYVSIANPLPWPGTPRQPWGRSRPGDNRWDNSIVKLDARTGRFLWGVQVLPHDLYDWDLECPVILAAAGGRRVALTAGKLGFVYAFDADTGRMLWRRSVGIHNGHDHDSAMAMRGDYSNIGYGRRIYPGDWGGVETQMASDGDTVYVPVNDLYAVFHAQTLPQQQSPLSGYGEVVAIDIATGQITWDTRLPHGVYGGATITNDLVFTTTYDGTVFALNRTSGAIVWKGSLPAGSIAPVAVDGDTLIAAGGIPLKERHRMALVAYRLGGTAGGGG